MAIDTLSGGARVKTYLDMVEAFRNQKRGTPMATDWDKVHAQKGELAKYLGTTDYDAQLQESQKLTKLQMALALAQRGFASMGAAPQRGESPIGTIGRTLLSPIAADIAPIAGRLMQQRVAAKAAREKEDRDIKLAAFQQVQTQAAEERATALKLMPPLKDTLLSNLVQHVNVPLTYKKDGKTVTENVSTNVNVVRNKQNTFRQITLLGDVTTPNGREFPAGFVVSNFSKITKDGEAIKQGTRGFARRLDIKGAPTGPIFPVNYEYKNGEYAFRGIGTKDTSPIIVEGDGRNAVLVSQTTGEPFAPAAETTDVYKDHLVVVDSLTNKPKVDLKGRRIGVSRKGNRLFRLGSDIVYIQPRNTKLVPVSKLDTAPKAADPKGLDSPVFQAQFLGFMNSLSAKQTVGTAQGVMGAGLIFNPGIGNLELDPSKPLPFARADGVELDEAQKKVLAKAIKSQFMNTLKTFKPGPEGVDLNTIAARDILGKNLTDWGYKAKWLPEVKRPLAAYSSAERTEAFKIAGAALLVPGTVASKVFESTPRPNAGQLDSGIARAVILTKSTPELMGLSTTAPAPDDPDRDAVVENMDPRLIEQRLIAEKVLMDPGLAATLNARLTPTLEQQQAAIANAYKAKAVARNKVLNTANAREDTDTLAKGLNVLELLNRHAVAATRAGLLGWARGPTEAFFFTNFGWTPGDWFRKSEEGKAAAADLIAMQPILTELVARDQLKATGERMFSKADLQGVQKAFPKLGKSKTYNAALVKQLRGYLLSGIKNLLNRSGQFDPGEENLRRAVALGIDLGKIRPKNELYSPWFKGQRYSATKQPAPSYSDEYKDRVRGFGILERTTIGGRGPVPPTYRLIKFDRKGLPVKSKERGSAWQTRDVTRSSVAKATAGSPIQIMIDHNIQWLMYRFDIKR